MTPPAHATSTEGAAVGGSGKATAIILARAGSKGVPGKNTRDIAGRPCIAWTIEHAQRAGSVGLVAVSSDDPRALDIARSMGALALDRSPALATDTARIDDAAREAVLQIERGQAVPRRPHDQSPSQREGLGVGSLGAALQQTVPPANSPIVILYANVPIRPAGLIDRAVELLVRTGCDSVQSYQPVGKHHPWWTARVGDDGAVRPWEGDILNHAVFRRQDLPPAFIPDVQHLHGQTDGSRNRQRRFRVVKQPRSVESGDIVHREVHDAVCLSDISAADDVRMVERFQNVRLAQELQIVPLRTADRRRDRFNGHDRLVGLANGAIHGPLRTATKFIHDEIAGQRLRTLLDEAAIIRR